MTMTMMMMMTMMMRMRMGMAGRVRFALTLLAVVAGAILLQDTATAQVPVRDSIPTDVRVGILYQPAFRPGVVMPPVPAPDELRSRLQRPLPGYARQ
jgi:hypothetical protein